MDVLVEGLHGFGDCIHQRAIVRSMLKYSKAWRFFLQTAYPCLYWDLVGERLQLVDIQSRLRCQAKNAIREQSQFVDPPATPHKVVISYDGVALHPGKTLIEGLAEKIGLPSADLDFSLGVKREWYTKLSMKDWPQNRPWLVVRPLTERAEWAGYCTVRNPDFYAYHVLHDFVQSRMGDPFVISVADLAAEPAREWLVGLDPPLYADVKLHSGELDPEQLIALFASADLIYSSPGFALPLSLALGTKIICVFGGFECADAYTMMKNFLPIQPINPCPCYNKEHNCNKTIDLVGAMDDIREFV